MIMTLRRWAALLTVAALACAGALQPLTATARPAGPDAGSAATAPASGPPVRGWTLLSDSDRGADEVLAAAPAYGVNHLQISHHIVHDLRQVREERRRVQANRITAAAHRAGIGEVAIWDHALYRLDHYPERFRTGPGSTIDLDNPAFWEWFKNDYREMLDLVPDVDAVVLTFIETGARVERQHSTRLLTEEAKLAHLVDQVADVVNEERGLGLYLRTFGYFPQEMERTIKAIDLVENPAAKVMIKAMPHDFFLTHPVDTTVTRIKRPVLVEYDTTGEYHGQGKIANALVEDHVGRMRYYQKQPNVIGYVARTDRYKESRIVGTPTEINLYALARADRDRRVRPGALHREWAARTYGPKAAARVGSALAKSPEIVSSVMYMLGTNNANHSRLDYDPYCNSYDRSISGKWIDPPHTFVRHTVNKRYHFWTGVIEHLAPGYCKTSAVMQRENPHVIANGWLTGANTMNLGYLRDVLKEKRYGVSVARSALRDIQRAERDLSPAHHRQLTAYFERTLLTARLHLSVSAAYFGYRVWVRGPEHRTPQLGRLIWAGLDAAKATADAMRAHPDQGATGEWEWIRDAAEADKYHTRISQGWDRYDHIAVPRPADPER
ncbi:hypothetical protein [Streptomyces clavuligerus]|nr:hypothetical protein [Streptomyces clavuligerus]ANW17285.1 hypothetical protein BB341_03135 [Streptomyces clavuligerus]AXU11831.1 hypothetical protein D1794_03285 [Streptomyces clavuligerus]MBY6301669.1 hypothetical protein [Streptomyces clavuligerus]QCS04609.1 hypothetical protein CRV15_02715 [Streptomyces clavuligerus]QPJ96014.1 hypothetical protein GE265_25175 [Streptomyces clavuligerus]